MATQRQIDRWKARLLVKEALLAKYDVAITAVASGVTSYTINTGQTTQTVTRSSLNQFRSALADLEREIDELDELINGTNANSLYVRPDY